MSACILVYDDLRDFDGFTLWQCSPASNPGYALVNTNIYQIPEYGQIRLILRSI